MQSVSNERHTQGDQISKKGRVEAEGQHTQHPKQLNHDRYSRSPTAGELASDPNGNPYKRQEAESWEYRCEPTSKIRAPELLGRSGSGSPTQRVGGKDEVMGNGSRHVLAPFLRLAPSVEPLPIDLSRREMDGKV